VQDRRLLRIWEDHLPDLRDDTIGEREPMNRLRFSRCLVASVLACSAAMADAEENCGRMRVTAIRFEAAIQNIEPLGQRDVALTSVDDLDARYLASLRVISAQANDVIEKETVLNAAIHSPARTFGAGVKAGSKAKLELEAMYCDGVFRRYIRLGPRSSRQPETFRGPLEVGKTYRAKLRWDARGDAVLAVPLSVPIHQAGGVDWLNPEVIADLGKKRRERSIVFEVKARETTHMGEREWVTIYQCLIKR
jgi:hypothetical protein